MLCCGDLVLSTTGSLEIGIGCNCSGVENEVLSYCFACSQYYNTSLFFQNKLRYNQIIRYEVHYLLAYPASQSFIGRMVAVIILMSDYQQFSSSFYKDQNLTIPSNYIFDDVYKSASDKYKYSKNPKYTYYNTLLTLKQKLSQNQSGVYNNVFNNNSKPKIQHVHPSPQKKSFMPIYHVEKINKMKFKVYKQGVGSQYVEKLPVTDLSFQIRMRGEEGLSIKPRLQEILSEYRKMNGSGRHSQAKQDIGKYGNNSDYNVRMMNKTMNKINRSMSHRK